VNGTGSIWLYVILALNFGISWWNARTCGRAWVESKAVGGYIRVLVWCGAIQSAIGFSSVFLFPMIFAAQAFFPEYFTDDYLNGALGLWYITVIFPVLGTGLIITIESWIAAYREHSPGKLGGRDLQYLRSGPQHDECNPKPRSSVSIGRKDVRFGSEQSW
jgi:hypothetical protein